MFVRVRAVLGSFNRMHRAHPYLAWIQKESPVLKRTVESVDVYIDGMVGPQNIYYATSASLPTDFFSRVDLCMCQRWLFLAGPRCSSAGVGLIQQTVELVIYLELPLHQLVLLARKPPLPLCESQLPRDPPLRRVLQRAGLQW